MGEVVSVPNKFESIAGLPASFTIDDTTSLRKITPEDSETFAGIIESNPDIRKYVTWASQVHDANDVIPVLQQHSDKNVTGRYAVVHQGSIAGYIGIFPGLQEDEYGMGYFIDKSARDKGLASKSVGAILAAAKTTLSPKHMYLQIDPDNTASVTIATKFGFEPSETIWDPDLQLNEQRFRLEIPNEQTG